MTFWHAGHATRQATLCRSKLRALTAIPSGRTSSKLNELLTVKVAAALLFCALLNPALGSEIQGRVVHVIDGDGLIVLVGEKRFNVRLEHIDAPERGQPYGTQSRQSLIAICGGQPAMIQASGKDRNGRTLGRVTCSGKDANAEQVRRGMAWVFNRYGKPDSPLYALQEQARAAHRGLWAASQPQPPWEWRKREKPRSPKHQTDS